MKILIACEFSGIVRDSFKDKGHDVISCDLLPTEKQGKHYQGDIFDIIDNDFDMMIAHPPCTYLSNSGVSWLYRQEDRWNKMELASMFFKRLLESDIDKIAIENPIQHKYAREIIGKKYNQIIQPWQFGHTEKKSTCLWLKNLPSLAEENNVKEEMELLPKNKQQRLHYLPPSKDRWKLRSTTYQGIANAMANQWG